MRTPTDIGDGIFRGLGISRGPDLIFVIRQSARTTSLPWFSTVFSLLFFSNKSDQGSFET